MNANDPEDGRDTASSNFLEEFVFEDLGVDLDARAEELIEDDVSEYDEAYVQVRKATVGAAAVLDTVDLADERGVELLDGIDAEYLHELEAAYECGEEIQARTESMPALKRDLSGLDLDLLVAARGTLGYVAPHLGVDLSLPSPAAAPIEDHGDENPFRREQVATLDFGDAQNFGDGYKSVLTVIYIAGDIIQAIRSRMGGPSWPSDDRTLPPEYIEAVNEFVGDPKRINQQYADEVTKAWETGSKIMDQAEENPEIQRDLSALDRDLLSSVRGSVQPVAHHLGIGMSVPAPGRG